MSDLDDAYVMPLYGEPEHGHIHRLTYRTTPITTGSDAMTVVFTKPYPTGDETVVFERPKVVDVDWWATTGEPRPWGYRGERRNKQDEDDRRALIIIVVLLVLMTIFAIFFYRMAMSMLTGPIKFA